MDRLPPLERDEAPPAARPIYDQDERRFGVVLNPTRIFAYRPPILAAAKGLSRAVGQEAALPEATRTLVCLHVAMLVGCPF